MLDCLVVQAVQSEPVSAKNPCKQGKYLEFSRIQDGFTRVTPLFAERTVCWPVADNKLAENAGWDRNLLALEFEYLSELEIDFDLSLTGFELPEIDIALGEHQFGAEGNAPDPADSVPEPADGPPATRMGDVWHIGPHRLICGSSLKREIYVQLLGKERAQMVFTDPPFSFSPRQAEVAQ